MTDGFLKSFYNYYFGVDVSVSETDKQVSTMKGASRMVETAGYSGKTTGNRQKCVLCHRRA